MPAAVRGLRGPVCHRAAAGRHRPGRPGGLPGRRRASPGATKNEFFAWLVAETFLNTNGVTPHYEPEEALALVMRAKHKGAPVQEIAAQLRAWSTAG